MRSNYRNAVLRVASSRVFSRDVVLGGKMLLWGEKNVKNIQKTNEICYCLGGGGGGGNSKLRGGNFPP